MKDACNVLIYNCQGETNMRPTNGIILTYRTCMSQN